MSSSSKTGSGEFELIAKYFAPLAGEGAFKLTDDAAIFKSPPGQDVVITADALVEDVHFFKTDPPETIARKALRVNLSDLAAKGAIPRGYLLALSLPEWVDDLWLQHFAEGLQDDQKTYGIALLGGDTTHTPGPLTLSITALGHVKEGAMLTRGGAKPDDLVFVTGTIGDAGAGLAVLKGEGHPLNDGGQREFLIDRYRLPKPRSALGPRLIGLASAALDVSDGLIADLGHIAEVSKVGIAVDGARIPLSFPLKALWGEDENAIVRAATSGDDYEIAFTAPPAAKVEILAAAAAANVVVSEIGRVESPAGVRLLNGEGQPLALEHKGYRHR